MIQRLIILSMTIGTFVSTIDRRLPYMMSCGQNFFETLAGQGKFFCKNILCYSPVIFLPVVSNAHVVEVLFYVVQCLAVGQVFAECILNKIVRRGQFVSDDNKGICSESTKISACDSSQLDDCGYSLISVDSQNRSRSPTNTVTSSEFVTNPGLLGEESEGSHVSLPVTTAAGDSTVVLQRDFRTDSTDFSAPASCFFEWPMRFTEKE